MQQMASRNSDALGSASKIKMRHNNTRQNKCDQKHQDAEVNITSCNGISFFIPWSSNKTNTKDDTYQTREEKPVELMRYLRFSLYFCIFKTCVSCTFKSRHAMVVWTPDVHALNMLYEEFHSRRRHIGEDPWS